MLKLLLLNLFILNPLIIFILKYFSIFRIKFYKIFFSYKEEKKILKEIPTLIDYLKSYMISGLLLPAAISNALKYRQWCMPIQSSLEIFCNNYAHGKSFQESLSEAILLIKSNKNGRHLSLLYISLRLGYSTGENINNILEKVKHKTQDCLNLERKLTLTTAQMRLQSFIVILSPVFLSIVIYFIAPDHILFFFHCTLGRVLLILMISLNILGAYFLKKILAIK